MRYFRYLSKALIVILLISFGSVFGQNEACIGSTEYATLADACAAANTSGGTVVIETLVENITMSASYTFNKSGLNVTLRTKDGLAFGRTTITKSFTTNSMFVFSCSNGSITVENLIFDGNNQVCAGDGGSIIRHTAGMGVFVTNTTFQNCIATNRGGAIYANNVTDSITITDSKFEAFKVSASGGAVYQGGTGKLKVDGTTCGKEGVTERANIAGSEGGAIYTNAVEVEVDNSNFYGFGTASASAVAIRGGAIYTASTSTTSEPRKGKLTITNFGF